MNYQTIFKDNMLNGEGLRVVLWLSGCSHNCPGCHNPETHDPKSGKKFTPLVKQQVYEELNKEYIEGITLSGGDPLFLENRDDVTKLVKDIRKKFPNKTIWMYTGYTFEEVKDLDIIKNGLVDVLCDGRFVLAKNDPKLHYVGSSNQRIIDVKKTINSNEVVLHCENHD